MNAAMNQTQRHALGRKGEAIVQKITKGKKTAHKAPFDVVDFENGIAYEVKAMSNLGKDLKIHITEKSLARKIEFADFYGLEMMLVVVVIHGPGQFELYWGRIQTSVRLGQLIKVGTI